MTVPMCPEAPVMSTRRGSIRRYPSASGRSRRRPPDDHDWSLTREPPTMDPVNELPAPTTRVRQGRWLGGVCAGLAERWGVPVGRVRLGFVIASVFLGLGAL